MCFDLQGARVEALFRLVGRLIETILDACYIVLETGQYLHSDGRGHIKDGSATHNEEDIGLDVHSVHFHTCELRLSRRGRWKAVAGGV